MFFVIFRLSRAMRSLRHMIELAEQLRERGIGLVVLKQAIDTTTPHGRLVFHILAAINEVQRELIGGGPSLSQAEKLAAIHPDGLMLGLRWKMLSGS
jgi:DNA invertase Pin-like site-specific DNA recombinase